jgi:hypothetical protein
VKARFIRLVNVGLIKSVSPIFDTSLVEDENILKQEADKQQQNISIDNNKAIENQGEGNRNAKLLNQQEIGKFKIKKGLKIKITCEFCKGPISGSPHVYRFANYERFFCCTGCISGTRKNMLEE